MSVWFALLPLLLVAYISLDAIAAEPSVSVNPGRDIAANCANCHGTDGRSRGIVPALAGREKATIVAQMKAFRDGTRPATVMQQLAKGYTDAQIDAAAAYLSTQKAAP